MFFYQHIEAITPLAIRGPLTSENDFICFKIMAFAGTSYERSYEYYLGSLWRNFPSMIPCCPVSIKSPLISVHQACRSDEEPDVPSIANQ